MSRLMAVILQFLVAASVHGQEYDYEEFQLFTNCQQVYLLLNVFESDFGLTEERVRTVVENRLRAARLNAPDVESTDFLLSVGVEVKDQTVMSSTLELAQVALFEVALAKRLFDPVTDEYGAGETWSRVGYGVIRDTDALIQAVSELIDEFINEYLRVNERACE